MGDHPDHHRTPQPGRPPRAGVLGVIAAALLFPALGAATGVALTLHLVLPTLGLGGVQRIVDLADHVDAMGAPPDVAFVGNSITVEGVDAGIVAGALGRGAENWSVNGCGLGEQLTNLPRLLERPPRVVVFSLQVGDLGPPSDVVADKAFAYAIGGYADAWPEGWTADDLPGVTRETVERLRASRVEAAVHFRSAPLSWFNDRMRRLARGGIRDIPPDQRWTSPYELEGSISGWKLERHVEVLAEFLESRDPEGAAEGSAQLARLVDEITARGAGVLLSVAPHHPEIRARFGAPLAELAAFADELATGEGVWSMRATDLVGADGFADAIHLNADGRGAYSRRLADRLAEILQGDGG